jgi:hypothetical protein
MFGRIFIIGMLISCEETESDPNQFNAHDESLSILVGIPDLGAPRTRTLFSTTGLVEVGTASISPGTGPIGTVHLVQVEVLEEYTDKIQEVQIDIDSGDRGALTYTLVSDSAQTNLYVLDLESVGDVEEEREDTFLFSLWDIPVPTEEETTDGSTWLP